MKLFICISISCFILNFSVKSQTVDTIKVDRQTDILWITNQSVPKSVVQASRSYRDQLLTDKYRPAFHFAIPGNGETADPNGAFYANGRYHLMYLYKREDKGNAWGHISSKDMLHWRYHPDAILASGAEDGIYSGGAYVGKDNKVTLSYWQYMDLSHESFASKIARLGPVGVALTESTDANYNIWTKIPENPVIRSTDWGITEEKDKNGEEIIYASADPSNIWYKDGKYYMLTGNLLVLNKYGRKENSLEKYQGGHAYLFVSDDMKKWEYLHEFYDKDRKWTEKSEDSMCASFLPLPSSQNGGPQSGKYLLLFISHNKGGQYYVGDYKNDKFYPESHGRNTWVDKTNFAPEALIDDKGRQIMWSWIFDYRPDSLKIASGWTGTYSLPRTLWLGKDGQLRMAPVNELKNLRQTEKSKENLIVKDGSDILLDGFGKELLEIEVLVNVRKVKEFGVKVGCSDDGREQTLISYDVVGKTLNVNTERSSLGFGKKVVETAPLVLADNEQLKLRIFLDRSIVEVFANDKQAIARPIYPTLDGTIVKLFSKGGDAKVISVKAWEMMPSNPF